MNVSCPIGFILELDLSEIVGEIFSALTVARFRVDKEKKVKISTILGLICLLFHSLL